MKCCSYADVYFRNDLRFQRYRELVSKLLQYLNCQHPTVMRRMTLNGILNSFSKSSEKSKIGTAESTQEEVSKADLITPSVRMRKRLRSKVSISPSISFIHSRRWVLLFMPKCFTKMTFNENPREIALYIWFALQACASFRINKNNHETTGTGP